MSEKKRQIQTLKPHSAENSLKIVLHECVVFKVCDMKRMNENKKNEIMNIMEAAYNFTCT